jgi:hypothetical protein
MVAAAAAIKNDIFSARQTYEKSFFFFFFTAEANVPLKNISLIWLID